MPSQMFACTVKYPSGKTKEIQVQLVNFRGDPDDPEDMDRAHRIANRLTPVNAEIIRDTFKIISDNPEEEIKVNGVADLAQRPPILGTETLRTHPPRRHATKVDNDESSPTVSRAVREGEPEKNSG